jgi:hypothetical protein
VQADVSNHFARMAVGKKKSSKRRKAFSSFGYLSLV